MDQNQQQDQQQQADAAAAASQDTGAAAQDSGTVVVQSQAPAADQPAAEQPKEPAAPAQEEAPKEAPALVAPAAPSAPAPAAPKQQQPQPQQQGRPQGQRQPQPQARPQASAAPAKPAQAAAPAPVVTAPRVPSDEFELPLSASGSARLVIQELKEYISKMSSKVRMTPADGGQVQTMLYHILLQVINTKAEEFDMVFGLTMKLIRANLNGAFSDTAVHRYTPHVSLPAAQAATLRYLVNVLTALADPTAEARKIAMRQVNIEQALNSRVIKEEARQRVMAFFNYQ